MNVYRVKEKHRSSGETRIVSREGLPTPLSGLAIVRFEDHYTLTHIRSGLQLFTSGSPESLARTIPHLAGVDWTQSGADLRDDPDAVRAAREGRVALGDDYIPNLSTPDYCDLPAVDA